MFPYHLSADLSLELLEPRHGAELFRLTDANRKHLREWLPWVDATQSVSDTTAFIESTSRQLADNNGFQTAIRLAGDLVGVVGHHGIDWGNRSASLGYWLALKAQGKGVMTRSCRAFVELAFSDMGLNRLEIRCATGNARSRAIPERLGFRLEGTVIDAEWLYDHFVDHAIYGLVSRDRNA